MRGRRFCRMATYRATYLNDQGDEVNHDFEAASEGDAIRQAKKLKVALVLERDGRVVAELQS